MSTTLIMCIAIVSAFLYILAAVFKGINLKKISITVWIAAVFGNAVLVANNWILNGYIPFVSMYQVLTFISLTFSLVFLYIKYVQKLSWMDIYFCILPAFCLIGVCFMGIGTKWTFPPALQSPWFIPHVLVYMIAYTLSAVAFIITIISFINKTEQQKLEDGVYNLILIAFPFMTAGMFFGAIWANEVWGNFWSFDIKENWALVSWLMFSMYLHFRRHKSFNKFSKYFVILGFICIVVTMFFVNIMGGSSQHTYS